LAVHVDFDRFHLYDELTAILRQFAEAYPALARLQSIGKSYEGRDIWVLEISNRETGDPDGKPGYYIDGNIHAGEVTGAACCLYTIHYLLNQYGQEAEATRLVDTMTFYIVPRVSPDGAEKYLTSPYMLRSSVRPYPFTEEQDGFVPEDMDGDGRILQMRIADPDGEWKISLQDARLMVPRLPHESGGQYYRLYLEGYVRNYDGVEVKAAPPRWGLDLNRNFPVEWQPEAKQPGAGPYPLSEPETRTIAEFILNHKNITGIQSYHTTSGVILRPSSLRPDTKMNKKDLAAFRAIGKLGEELTSYPCVSVHDGFAYDRDNPIKGVFLDWCYDNLGLLVYSTELWDMRVRAGLQRVSFLVEDPDPEAEGLALLRWHDRELGGRYFVDWYAVEHPQFGPVELGGWKIKAVLTNCPPELLQAEAHKNCLFTLRHAAAAPRLEISRAAAEHLGDGVYRVEVVVRNRGYLPTNITEKAKEIKAARPVTVELGLPEGAELVLGKVKEEAGHLEGRVLTDLNRPVTWRGVPAPREKRIEWVVRAPAGGDLTVRAASEKAGRAEARLTLAGG
jgi:murein tripeptide amidase MpaA